jgi:hypothetical protein
MLSFAGYQLDAMKGQLEEIKNQLPELRKSADAASRAAKAAQEQATLMRKQMIGTQAAVIFLEPYGVDKKGNGHIVFLNRGGLIGHVSGSIKLTRLSLNKEDVLTQKQFSNLLVAPSSRSDIPEPSVTYSVVGMKYGFTPSEIEAITTNTLTEVLKMEIDWSYDDGFDNVLAQGNQCFSLITSPPWVATDGSSYSGLGGFIPCDE